MIEPLHLNMQLSESSFMAFKDDDSYKMHIKEKMAVELAKKILDSKMATFTYMQHNHDFGATIHVRINFQ